MGRAETAELSGAITCGISSLSAEVPLMLGDIKLELTPNILPNGQDLSRTGLNSLSQLEHKSVINYIVENCCYGYANDASKEVVYV